MAKRIFLDDADLDALEKLIDRTSLSAVLAGLSKIAGEKADHIRTNWQDTHLANCWGRSARQLEAVSAKTAARKL